MGTEIVQGNLSADWAEKLALAAKEQAQTERAVGNFFSTKSGVLSYGGMVLPGNKMEAIVVASMHENVLYTQPWNPDVQASPDCYAYSLTGRDMVPHPDADAIQAPACGQCRHLTWTKDATGKEKKACKQLRRLAVLPAGAAGSPEMVSAAMCGLLRVPIMSVKGWSKYVTELGVRNLPAFAVVTEISLVPDVKAMFLINFAFKGVITDSAVLHAIVARGEIEKQAMQSPYPKRAIPIAAPAVS